jgi:hypothetical protein
LPLPLVLNGVTSTPIVASSSNTFAVAVSMSNSCGLGPDLQDEHVRRGRC